MYSVKPHDDTVWFWSRVSKPLYSLLFKIIIWVLIVLKNNQFMSSYYSPFNEIAQLLTLKIIWHEHSVNIVISNNVPYFAYSRPFCLSVVILQHQNKTSWLSCFKSRRMRTRQSIPKIIISWVKFPQGEHPSLYKNIIFEFRI